MMSKLRLFVLVVCIQIIVVGAIYGISEAAQLTTSSLGEELKLYKAYSPDDVMFYYRIAGVAFGARDGANPVDDFGNGCISRGDGDGDDWFTAEVQLPECAVIDSMELFYYDNSTIHSVKAVLYSFDGLGNSTKIAEVVGSDAPGFSSSLSSEFSHKVDNENEALVVLADLDYSSDDTLMFCGVKFRYQCSLPSCTYLPMCFR